MLKPQLVVPDLILGTGTINHFHFEYFYSTAVWEKSSYNTFLNYHILT